jgi:hypothetical protein
MSKNKPNEVVYHVLSHHIDHYIQAKKIFKQEKCIKRGVMIGGKHIDEYMPQFMNFFKENLL